MIETDNDRAKAKSKSDKSHTLPSIRFSRFSYNFSAKSKTGSKRLIEKSSIL
jgi:hypothetical protein